MNAEERYAAVRACKFMDQVVEGAPYTTQVSVLREHGRVRDATCIGTGATAAATNASNEGSNIIADAVVNTASITSNATATNNITTFVANSNNGINGISHEQINPSVEEESQYTFLTTVHKIWQFANSVE